MKSWNPLTFKIEIIEFSGQLNQSRRLGRNMGIDHTNIFFAEICCTRTHQSETRNHQNKKNRYDFRITYDMGIFFKIGVLQLTLLWAKALDCRRSFCKKRANYMYRNKSNATHIDLWESFSCNCVSLNELHLFYNTHEKDETTTHF